MCLLLAYCISGFENLFTDCFLLCRVIVLDHHKTALDMLGGAKISVIGENVFQIIDMDRSGATIAYEFFKEKLLCGNSDVDGGHELAVREFERVKLLFDYVEDGDLWRWSLQNSKAFSSGLKDLNIEYHVRLNPSLFQQAGILVSMILLLLFNS